MGGRRQFVTSAKEFILDILRLLKMPLLDTTLRPSGFAVNTQNLISHEGYALQDVERARGCANKFMNKTAIILSNEEIAALPQSKRPLNCRLPSKIYHAVFETVGAASMCWTPRPTGVFDSTQAEKFAVELCFTIAAELERLGVDPVLINPHAPPQPTHADAPGSLG